MKKLTLLDTFDMEEQDVVDYIIDDLIDDLEDTVKAYEKHYHTSIGGFLQIARRSSRYGSIGGAGLTGGRYVTNVRDLFHVDNAMDLRVYLDNDGLHFDFYDHDGVNATVLKFITDSVLEKQDTATDKNGFTYDQTIDYLLEKKRYTKGTSCHAFSKTI